jgi:hypothetical protein
MQAVTTLPVLQAVSDSTDHYLGLQPIIKGRTNAEYVNRNLRFNPSSNTLTLDANLNLRSRAISANAIGSINASVINSGSVPFAAMPIGSVLQTQSAYVASATQLTSAGAIHELTTSLRINFTPVSAKSILYFECYGSFVSPQSNNLQYASFYNVTNANYVNLPPLSGSRRQVHWFNRSTSFDINDADFMYFATQDDSRDVIPRTYTVYHSTEGSTIQFLSSTLSTASGATYPLIFKITEIAK